MLLTWKTSASDIECGGILKQRIDKNNKDSRFTSGIWESTQKKYSTILAIINLRSLK